MVTSSAAEFTTPATLSETDTAYDSQDIAIDGTTVTIDGAHSFNSLLLTNSAVLTHSACTTTETHKLEVTVANGVVVDATSKVDVSGLGYIAGQTSGNTTVGGSSGGSGGSFGGLGGNWLGTANAVYGDCADPDDWGSGGGPDLSPSAGGGLVRLEAGSLVLEGQLLANGPAAVVGAGSGGGIYVAVTNLTGGGSIHADGGNNSGNQGAGGGGRVAVYAQDYSGFDVGNITATGGTSGNAPGGAGTVYVKDRDEPLGLLVIDASSGGEGVTLLGLAASNTFATAASVIIRGSNATVRLEHRGMMLDIGGSLRVEGSARMEVEGDLSVAEALVIDGASLLATNVRAGSVLLTNKALLTTFGPTTDQVHKLELVVTNAVVVDATSWIDVSGLGYLPGWTSPNTTVGASIEGFGGGAGGSYGGLGNDSRGTANAVYGGCVDPDDWGSGGRTSTFNWGTTFSGGAGGGLVRLAAGSLSLDGKLWAQWAGCGRRCWIRGWDIRGGAYAGGEREPASQRWQQRERRLRWWRTHCGVCGGLQRVHHDEHHGGGRHGQCARWSGHGVADSRQGPDSRQMVHSDSKKRLVRLEHR